MGSRKRLATLVSGAALAFLAVGSQQLLAAASGVVSQHPPISRPSAASAPDPCQLFSANAADALFSLKSGTPLPKKLTVTGTGPLAFSTCSVTHLTDKLSVVTELGIGGFGGPYKCYLRPKLGSAGEVCVSTVASLASSFIRFAKGGVYVSDDFDKTLSKEGALLYAFALVEYRTLKG